MPIIQLGVPKDVLNFQTFLLRGAKGNFCTLLFNKKFYIILDVKVIHICMCIVHKNRIILHFYIACHIKEKCAEFLFFWKFWFLVKNENTKRPGFYTLLVTSFFSNFPQLDNG